MSEWEEFCNSKGFSTAGEDYDKVIDSLERQPRQQALCKSAPDDLGLEEVTALLKRDLYGAPACADIDLMVWTGRSADICHFSLNGVTADEDDSLLLRLRDKRGEFYASLRMVIEDLRTTGLPLQLKCQLLMWDAKSQCVDSWQGLIRDSFELQRTKRAPVTQEEQNLLHLLGRAKAADHAFKPLLVATSEVEKALAGQVVEFLDGSVLSLEALRQSHLVFVTSRGSPLSLPLGAVDHFVRELHTRNGTYYFNSGAIRTVNGPARLTAGAITRVNTNNNYPTYYLRATHGTIYQPVFKKICSSEIEEHEPSEIFVTDGAHPLELNGTHSPDRFVTNLVYFDLYKRKLHLEILNEDILF